MKKWFLLCLPTGVLLSLLIGCMVPFDNFSEVITLSKNGKALISIAWEGTTSQKSLSISEQAVDSVYVVIDNKINDPNYSFTFEKGGWNLWTPTLEEGTHRIMAIDEGESATNSSNMAEFRIKSGSNIKIEVQPGGGVFIEHK